MSTETLPVDSFTPAPVPRIRQKVVLLNHPRRKLHLDKNLIDSSVEALSARYTEGSLFQDLSTGHRTLVHANLNCTGAWSFRQPTQVRNP